MLVLSMMVASLVACKPSDEALKLAAEPLVPVPDEEIVHEKTWIYTVEAQGGLIEFSVCVTHLDFTQNDCETRVLNAGQSQVFTFEGIELDRAYIDNIGSNPAWHTGDIEVTFQEVDFEGNVLSKNTVKPAADLQTRTYMIRENVNWLQAVLTCAGGC
jgi:hypothetical protein